MNHAFRYRESLLGIEFDSATFQIDCELSLDDVEELVFVIVLVPMEFTLQDAQTDHAVVDLTQRLVEPLVLRLFLQFSYVNQMQGRKLYISMD